MQTPLYVQSGSYINQMPLVHLSYIKETSWNTSGHTHSRTKFTHGGSDLIKLFDGHDGGDDIYIYIYITVKKQ